MSFLSGILSATGLGQILGIESDTQKAAKEAGQIQQQEAQAQAGNIQRVGDIATGRFDPLATVGQMGVDQAGFLGNPQAQFDSIQSNPLFQLGLQNLNEQTNKSAASRSRLSAGDTLQQLTQNATLAASPLIDRQRQDILGLLGIAQNTAGQQGQIDQNTARSVSDLMTGGAAAQAGGIVGAANAGEQGFGNLLDIAGLVAGAPPGTFSSLFSPTPPPSSGFTGGRVANFPPI